MKPETPQHAWQRNRVHRADGTGAVGNLPEGSVDLILSDIPYGISFADWDVLHPNTNSALLGSSPAQRQAGTVFEKRGKPINGWSQADRHIPRQYYDWCTGWAPHWWRALKPGASAIVFAGRRLAHRCSAALEDAGFNVKDMLAWERERAVYRAQRLSAIYSRRQDADNASKWQGWRVGNLRPSFEPILWFVKPYKIGTAIADNVLTYQQGGFNEAAFADYGNATENILRLGFEPGEAGKHPTQKPIRLLQALIELTTIKGQLIVDPFCGSGSTLVAAKQLGRDFIGFETDPDHVATAQDRLGST
jgi:site-specific DNA-methyltransferase (adenine-specific)